MAPSLSEAARDEVPCVTARSPPGRARSKDGYRWDQAVENPSGPADDGALGPRFAGRAVVHREIDLFTTQESDLPSVLGGAARGTPARPRRGPGARGSFGKSKAMTEVGDLLLVEDDL